MSDLGFSSAFLISALSDEVTETPDADLFIKKRSESAKYGLQKLPLTNMPGWRSGDAISHTSGRFFSIQGISIKTDFGSLHEWDQPIILQPEIGILGVLIKRIHGVHHFLMQAKMEPGNSDLVQFAATVQATPSNYEQVHGGRPTPYLEYFRERARGRVIFDQLLSEHGSWYLHKRNRNMIVEVPEDEELLLEEDFAWLTLRQLRQQLRAGSRVSMNARTVLSGIAYRTIDGLQFNNLPEDFFLRKVVDSYANFCDDQCLSGATTWLIDQKSRYSLLIQPISLDRMLGWTSDGGALQRRDRRLFSIVGMSVAASSREVNAWAQPMLQPPSGNVALLLCQMRAGVLHLLVQAVIQPGFLDRMEIAATAHFNLDDEPASRPPLWDYVNSPESWIRLNASQSEDGGRFFHADTAHFIIELPEDHRIDVPDNYRWMTLGLINRMIHAGYYVSIEARSLVACLL